MPQNPWCTTDLKQSSTRESAGVNVVGGPLASGPTALATATVPTQPVGMTTQIPAPPELAPAPRAGRWIGAVLVGVATVVAGFVLAALVFQGHSGDLRPARADVQLASVESACRAWTGSPGVDAPDEAWCRSMVTWMGGRHNAGMMPWRGWSTPNGIRAECLEWQAEPTIEQLGRSARWCDEMAGWMRNHRVSTDGGWMMPDR